jgi:hypothetical protein
MEIGSEYLGQPYIPLYPRLACLLGGADRALVLKQIDKLLHYHAQQYDPGVIDDPWFVVDMFGQPWFRTNYPVLQERFFPWLKLATLKRHIYTLRDAGYLLVRSTTDEHFTRAVMLSIDYNFLDVALKAIEASALDALREQNERAKGSKRSVRKDQNDPLERIKKIRSRGSKRSVDHEDHRSSMKNQDQPSTTTSHTPDDSQETDESDVDEQAFGTDLDSTDDRAARYQQCYSMLEGYGVKGDALDDLAAKSTPKQVQGWIDYIEGRKNIHRKAAYLVQMLGAGHPAPTPNTAKRDGWRYVEGEYKDEIEY